MGAAILDNGDSPSATKINAWLEAHGPAWSERVRAIYGDSADDVLAMVLGC